MARKKERKKKGRNEKKEQKKTKAVRSKGEVEEIWNRLGGTLGVSDSAEIGRAHV